MTQFNCNPWKFKEGDVAAIVALYDTVRRPYTNLRQHFIFRGDWFPDDPKIVDRNREKLIFKNLHFCGENANKCVSQMTLGYKIYMVIVNFGWMPEYSAGKAFLGWIILMALVALVSLGSYGLVKCVSNKYSPTLGECLPKWKVVFAKRVSFPSKRGSGNTDADGIPARGLGEISAEGLRAKRSSLDTQVLLSEIE